MHSKNDHCHLGSALKNNCRKGRNCNFLHIFKNPSDLFSIERTLREPPSVMNSQRNQMAQNEAKDEYVIKPHFVNYNFSHLLCVRLVFFSIRVVGASMVKEINGIGDGQRVHSKRLWQKMRRV